MIWLKPHLWILASTTDKQLKQTLSDSLFFVNCSLLSLSLQLLMDRLKSANSKPYLAFSTEKGFNFYNFLQVFEQYYIFQDFLYSETCSQLRAKKL